MDGIRLAASVLTGILVAAGLTGCETVDKIVDEAIAYQKDKREAERWDNNPPTPNPVPAPVPDYPASGGSLMVTVAPYPRVATRGQQVQVRVYVQDSQSRPVPWASVTLRSGGGRYQRTGNTTVTGTTDASGSFIGYWSCDPCAPAYVSGAGVSKSGYSGVDTRWQVDIR
jgi:hypothetical protein